MPAGILEIRSIAIDLARLNEEILIMGSSKKNEVREQGSTTAMRDVSCPDPSVEIEEYRPIYSKPSIPQIATAEMGIPLQHRLLVFRDFHSGEELLNVEPHGAAAVSRLPTFMKDGGGSGMSHNIQDSDRPQRLSASVGKAVRTYDGSSAWLGGGIAVSPLRDLHGRAEGGDLFASPPQWLGSGSASSTRSALGAVSPPPNCEETSDSAGNSQSSESTRLLELVSALTEAFTREKERTAALEAMLHSSVSASRPAAGAWGAGARSALLPLRVPQSPLTRSPAETRLSECRQRVHARLETIDRLHAGGGQGSDPFHTAAMPHHTVASPSRTPAGGGVRGWAEVVEMEILHTLQYSQRGEESTVAQSVTQAQAGAPEDANGVIAVDVGESQEGRVGDEEEEEEGNKTGNIADVVSAPAPVPPCEEIETGAYVQPEERGVEDACLPDHALEGAGGSSPPPPPLPTPTPIPMEEEATPSPSTPTMPTAAPIPTAGEPHVQNADRIRSIVLQLLQGKVFIKHGRRGWPKKKIVWLDASGAELDLRWGAADLGTSNAAARVLPLGAVQGVSVGRETSVLKSGGTKVREGMYWSILATDRTLDLEAESQAERDEWSQSFLLLMKEPGILQRTMVELFNCGAWRPALQEEDGNGTVQEEEEGRDATSASSASR